MFSFLRRPNTKSVSLFLKAVCTTKIDSCHFSYLHKTIKNVQGISLLIDYLIFSRVVLTVQRHIERLN